VILRNYHQPILVYYINKRFNPYLKNSVCTTTPLTRLSTWKRLHCTISQKAVILCQEVVLGVTFFIISNTHDPTGFVYTVLIYFESVLYVQFSSKPQRIQMTYYKQFIINQGHKLPITDDTLSRILAQNTWSTYDKEWQLSVSSLYEGCAPVCRRYR
jgi:hypothetical protein